MYCLKVTVDVHTYCDWQAAYMRSERGLPPWSTVEYPPEPDGLRTQGIVLSFPEVNTRTEVDVAIAELLMGA